MCAGVTHPDWLVRRVRSLKVSCISSPLICSRVFSFPRMSWFMMASQRVSFPLVLYSPSWKYHFVEGQKQGNLFTDWTEQSPSRPSQSLWCHSDRTVWQRQLKHLAHDREGKTAKKQVHGAACLAGASHAIAVHWEVDTVESVIKFRPWAAQSYHTTSFLSLLHCQGLVSKWVPGEKKSVPERLSLLNF